MQRNQCPPSLNYESNEAPPMKYTGYSTGIIISLLCAAVIFSGCTSPSSPPAPVTSSVPLAEYHHVGGIAFVSDHLYLYENGTAIISKMYRNTTLILNQSEISEIDNLLKQAPVISQSANDNSSRRIPDMIYTSVWYRGNEVKAPDSAYRKLTEVLDRVRST
jgi:hypothetical protein